MKTNIQGKLAAATLLGLAAVGSASAEPGDKYPDWGFFGGGQMFVPFDLGGNLDDFATDSVVGEDGSLYIAGTVRDTQGLRRIGIAKLDPDGVLDETFSGDGMNTSLLTNVAATGIALSDTRIYVVGYTTNNAPDYNMVVCQFVRSNGTNANFPNNGNSSCVSPDSLPGTQDIATDILLQPDGKIVIAGTMAGNVGQEVAAFARFEANGQRDTTFGTVPGANIALIRTDGVYVRHSITALAQGSNGKFVAVGSTRVVADNSDSALVIRISEDGADLHEFPFSRDGSATRETLLRDVVAVDDPDSENDAWLVAGLVELTAGKDSGFVTKVAADSDVLVNSFGEDAGNITAITLAGATDLDFTNIAMEPDGSIVTLGLRSPDGLGQDLLVRRFTADGGIDTMFGNSGNVIIDVGLAGEFHGPAAIGARGDGLYISGWAAKNPDTTNLDFIAAKLVSGSDPVPEEDFFANGFKDSFED